MKKLKKATPALMPVLLLLVVLPSLSVVSAQNPEKELRIISNVGYGYNMPPIGHWNPWVFENNIIESNLISQCGREPLAFYLMMNATWVPWLATSWEFDLPNKQFTVHLREGVLWQDYTPFTSKDVVSTSYLSYAFGGAVSIFLDKVEAVDDYTVVYTYDTVPVSYIYDVLWSYIQQYAAYANFTDAIMEATGESMLNPLDKTTLDEIREGMLSFRPTMEIGTMSTGPFIPTSVGPDELVLEKFDGYWKADNVKFDRIISYNVPRGVSGVAESMMLAEKVNFMCAPENPPVFERTVQDLGLTQVAVFPMPHIGVGAARWNCFKYPTSIKEVRQAIMWALNGTEYCIVGRGGAEFPLDPPRSLFPRVQLLQWCDPGFITKLTQYEGSPTDEYPEGYPWGGNIEKAKEILDNVPPPDGPIIDRDGDGIRETANGTKMSLIMYCYREDMSFGYTDQLKRIGIEIVHVWTAAGWADYIKQYNGMAMDAPEAAHAICTLWGIGPPHPADRWYQHIVGNKITMYVQTGGAWEKGMVWPEVVDVPAWVTEPWGTYSGPAGEVPGEMNITQTCIEFTREFDLTEARKLMQVLVWYQNEYAPLTPYATGGWWWCFNINEIKIPANIPDRWDPYACDPAFYIEPGHNGHNHIINLIALGLIEPVPAPPEITYVTVWMIEDVSKFLGADLKSYGPFPQGISTSLPTQDADRLVKEGKAAYSAPTPELEDILSATARIEASVNELSTSLSTSLDALTAKISTEISTLSTMLYATVALQVIVLIALVAVAAKVFRRPSA